MYISGAILLVANGKHIELTSKFIKSLVNDKEGRQRCLVFDKQND